MCVSEITMPSGTEALREMLLKAPSGQFPNALRDAFVDELLHQLTGKNIYTPQGLALVLLVSARRAILAIYGKDQSMMSVQSQGFIGNWLPVIVAQLGLEPGVAEEVITQIGEQFPAIASL